MLIRHMSDSERKLRDDAAAADTAAVQASTNPIVADAAADAADAGLSTDGVAAADGKAASGKKVCTSRVLTPEEKLVVRQRQIDLGKKTAGYQRYLTAVPRSVARARHRRTVACRRSCARCSTCSAVVNCVRCRSQRTAAHPRTPNIHKVCSKRSFDGLVRKWRRLLHDYDLPGDKKVALRRLLTCTVLAPARLTSAARAHRCLTALRPTPTVLRLMLPVVLVPRVRRP